MNRQKLGNIEAQLNKISLELLDTIKDLNILTQEMHKPMNKKMRMALIKKEAEL